MGKRKVKSEDITNMIFQEKNVSTSSEDDSHSEEHVNAQTEKSIIAFPFRRMAEVVFFELIVSAILWALATYGFLKRVNDDGVPFISLAGIIIYCGFQWFFLRAYCENVQSTIARIITNLLAHLVLTVLATASAYFLAARGGEYMVAHTLLFLPFKMFYKFGLTTPLLSSVLVGTVITAVDLLMLLCFREKNQKKDDNGEGVLF